MHALKPLRLVPLLALMLLASCSEDSPPPAQQEQTPPASDAKRDAEGTAGAPAAPPEAAKKPVAEAPTPKTGENGEPGMTPTPATVLRETELKDKPFVDAGTVKRLPAQAGVTIVERRGGWLRVQAGGQQGWVRLLHVSSQPAATGKSAGELESVAKMATGRSGSGNIVSTTGIRGLSEEQLREAKPEPAEVERLEGYAVDKEQAAAYARKHRLERRQIAHLPAPR